MKRKSEILLIILVLTGVFVFAFGASAVIPKCSEPNITTRTCDCSPANAPETCYKITPFAGASDVKELVCKAVGVLAKDLMPPVAVIMVLWASFLFLTAGPNPGKIVQARQILVFTIIGAGIMILAVPLVDMIVKNIGTSPTGIAAGCGPTGASAIEALLRLINWFSWGLAILAVATGLYAGFLYMTARGDPGKLATANRVLFYGVIGVAVAILSFSIIAIVNTFVGGGVVSPTPAPVVAPSPAPSPSPAPTPAPPPPPSGPCAPGETLADGNCDWWRSYCGPSGTCRSITPSDCTPPQTYTLCFP